MNAYLTKLQSNLVNPDLVNPDIHYPDEKPWEQTCTRIVIVKKCLDIPDLVFWLRTAFISEIRINETEIQRFFLLYATANNEK